MKATISQVSAFSKQECTEKASTITRMFKELDITPTQFKDLILVKKYTHCPGLFNGSKSNKNWVGHSMITIDIDNINTPEEVLKKCQSRDLMIEPHFIYTSFSDTPEKRKFRVIWFLSEVETDPAKIQIIYDALGFLFKGKDKKCDDLSHMFFPGNGCFYFNEEKVENIEKSDDDWLFDRCLDICEQTAGDPTNKTYTKKIYNNQIKDFKKKKDKNAPLLRNFNWDEACKNCKILNEFKNGTTRLGYEIFFGLATNLVQIEGGMKWAKSRIDEVNKTGLPDFIEGGRKKVKYSDKHIKLINEDSKLFDYYATRLEKFSPFEEDHQYHNILSCDGRGLAIGKVIITQPLKLISLSDAEVLLKTEWDRVNKEIDGKTKNEFGSLITQSDIFDSCENIIQSNNKIYIFKVATGLGKTELILNTNALLAFPTNNLKNEVKDKRFKTKNVLHTPVLEFSDESLMELIGKLYSAKLYKKVMDIVNEISNCVENYILIENKKYDIEKIDIHNAIIFKKLNEACRNNMGQHPILTTHSRVINDPSIINHNKIIFDEDPINSLVEFGEIEFIFSKFKGTKWESIMTEYENYYSSLTSDISLNIKKFDPKSDTKFCIFCIQNNMLTLLKLLDSEIVWIIQQDEFTTKKILFCKKKELPTNKNIIILSATAPTDLYEKLYPNQVEVIDISHIKTIGTLTQYTNKGFGKTSITKLIKEDIDLSFVKSELEGKSLITHKSIKHNFPENQTEFHFGNCSGGDNLKGKDIVVMGTPHLPEYVYLFWAKLCGINHQPDKIKQRIVERKGLKYNFMTFENKELQNIQISLIESEIIQAVGRARHTRFPCKVVLFSNLPLAISTQIIFK